MTATTEDPAGRWSSRWHRATGLILVVYLCFTLVELAILRRDPGAYNRLLETSGSTVMRVLACVVGISLVFHALDGVRIVLLEAGGASARVARRATLVVVFLTALAVLPLVALVFRSEVEGWWG